MEDLISRQAVIKAIRKKAWLTLDAKDALVKTIQNIPDTDLLLTKNEAYGIAEMIDCDLLQTIRDDPEIDSMQWLKNMVHAYEKLCEYSGYEDKQEDEETS